MFNFDVIKFTVMKTHDVYGPQIGQSLGTTDVKAQKAQQKDEYVIYIYHRDLTYIYIIRLEVR